MDNKNELGKLIKAFKERQDCLYDHTFLISTFCQHIQWDTFNTTRKLCAAALFHDIKLSDPNMAMITLQDDERLDQYSAQEKKLFFDHPRLASDLVAQISGAQFINVKDIVLQHHETPDGKGFPLGLYAQQISPLSSTFILIHTLVSMLYQVEFDLAALPDIIQYLKENYNKGNFKQVVPALEHLKSIDF